MGRDKPLCQKVLKHHFPEAQGFGDIKKFNYATFKSILRNRGIKDRRVDIITGGFPCQPYSLAGLRKGTDDDRHLWLYMLETIRQFKPKWVVGENVRGLVSWSAGLVFEQVQTDLEAIGYEVQAFVLPACAVDAPHRRDRVWIVAYRSDSRIESVRPKREKPVHENRITTNASSCNKGSSRASNCPQRDWSNYNPQSGERGESTQFNFGCTNVLWDAPNPMPTQRKRQIGGVESEFVASCEWAITYTDSTGLQKLNTPEQPSCSGHSSRCNNADATYSDSFRRIQSDGKPESRQFAKEIPEWRQFPTQRPIRERNDGISNRVAGYLTNALRYEIGKTSKDNRIENLQEVWEFVQQEKGLEPD